MAGRPLARPLKKNATASAWNGRFALRCGKPSRNEIVRCERSSAPHPPEANQGGQRQQDHQQPGEGIKNRAQGARLLQGAGNRNGGKGAEHHQRFRKAITRVRPA